MRPHNQSRRSQLLMAGLLCIATLAVNAQTQGASLISGVDAIDMTVSDIDRAVSFYSGVLSFKKISDREVAGVFMHVPNPCKQAMVF